MLTLLLQLPNPATGATLEWDAWIALLLGVAGGVMGIGGVALFWGQRIQELKRNTADIKELFDAQDEATKISLQTTRNLDRLTDRFDNLIELLDAGVLPKRRGSAKP